MPASRAPLERAGDRVAPRPRPRGIGGPEVVRTRAGTSMRAATVGATSATAGCGAAPGERITRSIGSAATT